MTPTSFEQSPSTGRPWWHYVLGGCGCLGATAVVILAVLAFAGVYLIGEASDVLVGGEEGKARAIETAESFLDAAEQKDGDKALALTDASFKETYSMREFAYILQDVHTASKRGERHFLETRVHMRDVDGHDEKVPVLYSLFEYRTGTDDDTPVCLVGLVDAAEFDDGKTSHETFEVHLAGCSDKASIEASL